MEYVDCVAGPIAYPSLFGILAVQYEVLESTHIYPIFLIHHAKCRVDPPRIAYIG